MKLVRTHTITGARFEDSPATFRDAEQRVVWCAHDNLEESRAEASEHGAKARRAWLAGEAYRLGPYVFELNKPKAENYPEGTRVRVGQGRTVWSVTGHGTWPKGEAYADLTSVEGNSSTRVTLDRLTKAGLR